MNTPHRVENAPQLLQASMTKLIFFPSAEPEAAAATAAATVSALAFFVVGFFMAGSTDDAAALPAALRFGAMSDDSL